MVGAAFAERTNCLQLIGFTRLRDFEFWRLYDTAHSPKFKTRAEAEALVARCVAADPAVWEDMPGYDPDAGVEPYLWACPELVADLCGKFENPFDEAAKQQPGELFNVAPGGMKQHSADLDKLVMVPEVATALAQTADALRALVVADMPRAASEEICEIAFFNGKRLAKSSCLIVPRH